MRDRLEAGEESAGKKKGKGNCRENRRDWNELVKNLEYKAVPLIRLKAFH